MIDDIINKLAAVFLSLIHAYHALIACVPRNLRGVKLNIQSKFDFVLLLVNLVHAPAYALQCGYACMRASDT